MKTSTFINGRDIFPVNRPSFLRVLHELYDDVSEGHDYVVTRGDLKDLYHELNDQGELGMLESHLRFCDDFIYRCRADGVVFVDTFSQEEIDNALNF